MRLTRYMTVQLLKFSLTAALILAFIAQILDLVDNAGDILDQGSGVLGILRYAGLKMPTLMIRSLPLGALVGAVMALLALARSSEIAPMRSAGISTWRMFRMMLPGALVLVVMQATLIDVVAPRTEARLALLSTHAAEDSFGAEDRPEAAKPASAQPDAAKPDAPPIGAANSDPAKSGVDRRADGKPGDGKSGDGKQDEPKQTFLRVGDAIVSFEKVSDRGKKLKGVTIYDRESDKLATARTQAAEARYEKKRWILKDAEREDWTREKFNVRTPADGVWDTTLTPDDVLSALTPESRISLAAARAVLAGQMTPNAPLPFYETLIERVYASPLGAIVMVLLAMPAAFVNWRDPRSARFAASAVGGGLIFLLCDGLLTTLALTGVIEPVIGAWSALAIFAVYGAWRVTRLDGGWPALKVRTPRRAGRLAEARR